uniref:Ig-like domain-containing protein n=1 Tax=Naja naja TaxID=35670 RepID=A0A8C6V8M8_NAJNA
MAFAGLPLMLLVGALGRIPGSEGGKETPAKPTVTISPTKMDPASPNTILLCTATGFYPLEIEVQWLKNGQLEEEGVAFGEEFQNGDWTYQLQVMLETQTQQGDVYTCQVGHASLEAPITVQWGKPLHSLPSCSEKGERPSLWGELEWALLGKGGPDPPAQVRLLLLPQSPVPPALPEANSGRGSWGP